MNDIKWQYELHPIHAPHLINVATLPCESQNTENVILQLDITKENCIICIIASSKWTRVIMCLTFTYLGCYTAKRVWNKDSWHRRPAKMLDPNLFWLWPEHHQFWHDHLRSCVHAGGGHFVPSHVLFIWKSNSENYIEIHWFLLLQTKISWLLFYGPRCINTEKYFTLDQHWRSQRQAPQIQTLDFFRTLRVNFQNFFQDQHSTSEHFMAIKKSNAELQDFSRHYQASGNPVHI